MDIIGDWLTLIRVVFFKSDPQPQVKKFTSCLPRVGGSIQVLQLPPPLKLVAMI